MSSDSSTWWPMSAAIWMTVSRVMPGRIDIASGGVRIRPSLTTKMFSPGPSATYPSWESMIASS